MNGAATPRSRLAADGDRLSRRAFSALLLAGPVLAVAWLAGCRRQPAAPAGPDPPPGDPTPLGPPPAPNS